MSGKRVPEQMEFAATAGEIAQEAGARVLMLDPVGGEKDRETYIGLMKYNLAMMEKAMR